MGMESIRAIIAIAVIVIGGGVILYRKPSTRNPIAYLLLATGVILSLFFGFTKTQPYATAAVQIWLMFGLVVVTSLYALSAHKQADASVKMAEEMEKQRYDTIRPVIDIQHAEDGARRLGELAASKNEIVSGGLPCILHNIGLGPAIDVYSFTQLNSDKYHRYDFGILGIGGKSDPKTLSVDSEGNRNRLIAYYKDTYGRKIESSREVQDREEGAGVTGGTKWELGPLQIRVINKGEEND